MLTATVTNIRDQVPVKLKLQTGPLPIPKMTHQWIWSNSGMILTVENQTTQRTTSAGATLSTTNPTWTALGTHLGNHGEKLAINNLSYDMSSLCWYCYIFTVHTVGLPELDLTLPSLLSQIQLPEIILVYCIINPWNRTTGDVLLVLLSWRHT
jgi:hypothetical protein